MELFRQGIDILEAQTELAEQIHVDEDHGQTISIVSHSVGGRMDPDAFRRASTHTSNATRFSSDSYSRQDIAASRETARTATRQSVAFPKYPESNTSDNFTAEELTSIQ